MENGAPDPHILTKIAIFFGKSKDQVPNSHIYQFRTTCPEDRQR